jgi:hypothetical protein
MISAFKASVRKPEWKRPFGDLGMIILKLILMKENVRM